jgi:hypothetical protein
MGVLNCMEHAGPDVMSMSVPHVSSPKQLIFNTNGAFGSRHELPDPVTPLPCQTPPPVYVSGMVPTLPKHAWQLPIRSLTDKVAKSVIGIKFGQHWTWTPEKLADIGVILGGEVEIGDADEDEDDLEVGAPQHMSPTANSGNAPEMPE